MNCCENCKLKVQSFWDSIRPSDDVKTILQNIVSRIWNFIKENRGTLFFGATVLFTLLITPNPFKYVEVASLIASGAMVSCALHALGWFIRATGLSKEVDENISLCLGGVNLAAWVIDPSFGVATSLFTSGMKGASLAFRYIFRMHPQ